MRERALLQCYIQKAATTSHSTYGFFCMDPKQLHVRKGLGSRMAADLICELDRDR